jgi:hypothetical protein
MITVTIVLISATVVSTVQRVGTCTSQSSVFTVSPSTARYAFPYAEPADRNVGPGLTDQVRKEILETLPTLG